MYIYIYIFRDCTLQTHQQKLSCRIRDWTLLKKRPIICTAGHNLGTRQRWPVRGLTLGVLIVYSLFILVFSSRSWLHTGKTMYICIYIYIHITWGFWVWRLILSYCTIQYIIGDHYGLSISIMGSLFSASQWTALWHVVEPGASIWEMSFQLVWVWKAVTPMVPNQVKA